MKKLFLGLLVAGVALSASAFTTFDSYTFYNTSAILNSTNPADYKYVSGSCDSEIQTNNCSTTISLDTPPSANASAPFLGTIVNGTYEQ